ncbi:MAG: phosphonate ABC transporter, permease protein PhnE [Alphaproteobacteria bacterium]|nr:phosphonate ABC transporter, permease protein PhnE [Hyphomonas sp.]MBR9807286.1 phosphonate ABC transporter, permease protein PhnE [Alphaproteobacteria bacterium]|tara:strand:- start:59 stop:1072 length:1014 start_codon:yes stop_codon:yes gene_type:complete
MTDIPTSSAAQAWRLKQPYGWRTLLVLAALFVFAAVSAERMQFDRMLNQIGDFAFASVGLKEDSQIGRGMGGVFQDMFPIAIAERRPVELIEHFDETNLPLFSHVETVRVDQSSLDPDTLQMNTITVEKAYLVEPVGYLVYVLGKMVETIEIAAWASLIAILFSLPLAWLCAGNYSPHPIVYGAARSLVSFFRAVPELISALFLVLAFGFGPIAGILALTLHSIGFLAKFYAEDIESADTGPQEALKAAGANDFTILRLAVLPQVLPSYTGLSFYILDRNIRMATVIGLVGAGGIGQELKGRFDMFQYDRVGTILLVIFLTVMALDLISARFRRDIV